MKVIEKFIQAKTGKSNTCEDYIFMDEHFAVVIDGVSSKTKSMHGNKTTGQLGAELIIKAIEKFDSDITAENAVRQLTKTIQQYYIENGIYDKVKKNPVERASACVAIYSSFQRQVWIVGDCQCLLEGNIYSNKFKMDDTASEVRSLFLKMERLKGKTIGELLIKDTGREYIAPILNNQALFENYMGEDERSFGEDERSFGEDERSFGEDERSFGEDERSFGEDEYSYGAVNGFEVPISKIKIVEIGEKAEFIVLASDGYPMLKDTLYESEEQLKFIIDKDPLCMDIYKSTKGMQEGNVSFDDRAYLKIKVERD